MVFTILLTTANTPLNVDGLRWKTRDVWYKAIYYQEPETTKVRYDYRS